MTPFLQSVAKYLFDRFGNNLHNIALVFPNKRARLFFNQELAKITKKPLLAPKYYTINEYLQNLSGYIPADQITLLFTLYEVFVKITGSKESFDEFMFYCEMLLADFDDLDKYNVDASMLFRNLSDLKNLENYFDYLEPSQIQAIKQFWSTFSESKESDQKQKFSSLWNVLYKIYEEFNLTLNKQSISYEGMAFKKAIEEIKNGATSIREQQIAFVGFNALNKCERELFHYLHKQKRGLFFWDWDTYYRDKVEGHEAAFFLKDFIREFPAPEDFKFETCVADPNRKIEIYDIVTNTGQAKILPQILESLPDNWKTDPTKTAITLADESLLLPVLNALPADIDVVNISMGYPLKETKAYNLLCQLLDLHKNKRSKEQQISFYHKDVVSILHNPLIIQQDETIQKIQDSLVGNNLVYITSDQIDTDNSLIKNLFEKNVNTDTFISYLKEIINNIELAGIESKNNYIIEREAIFRINNQLTRIGDILDSIKTPYNYASLTRLLSKLLESTTIPFSGEPLLGMQVMGVLETRTLDFENVVILSLNEGIFPKSGNVPSFIPYSLRKGFDMPTVEHQDAIFAYYFYRLLHRVKNLKLVYSSSVKESISGEPSRLIQQLIYEKAFHTVHKTFSYKVKPLSTPILKIPKNTTTLNLLKKRFNPEENNTLSPSAINTYLNCKTRFYFHYIKNIKEPETLVEGIEANVFGSILHKTLEDLNRPFFKKVVSSDDIKKIKNNKQLIDETLTKAFWEEYIAPKDKNYPGYDNIEISGQNKLTKEIIFRYIENVLEYDSKQAPLIIHGLEEKVKMPFTSKNGITIHIGGIIDRIDEVNNLLRVIDYKTGKVKNSFNSIEALFNGEEKRNDAAFQTILYALILEHEKPGLDIMPGLFFVRNIKISGFTPDLLMGKGKAKQKIGSVLEVKDEFEPLLHETLNKLFSTEGDFNQTENLEYCKVCPYKNLCNR